MGISLYSGSDSAERGRTWGGTWERPAVSLYRVQILVKTAVNDKRQKARIPATKLQWLPARHAILTSGSGRTLDGRESLRAGRDAQLLPCRPAVRYPGPNAHTGPDGRTSVNQPLRSRAPPRSFVWGGGRIHGHPNLPTPKIHFLLGFRPPYFENLHLYHLAEFSGRNFIYLFIHTTTSTQ